MSTVLGYNVFTQFAWLQNFKESAKHHEFPVWRTNHFVHHV